MKKKRRGSFILSLILLSLGIAGCGNNGTETEKTESGTSKKEEESQMKGSWEDTVFKNTWSHLVITVPQDAIVFMPSQFKDAVTIKENQVWDMLAMLSDWDSEIGLYYERIQSRPIDLNAVLKEKFQELEAPEGLEYQINGWEEVELGGEKYQKMETSVLTHKFMDFYAREQDGYVIMLFTRYTLQTEEQMNDVLSHIERI